MKFENEPQVCSAKQAAQYMVNKKKMLVITGAGISAASGIPTFRGAGGLWTSEAKSAMDLLTTEGFKNDPELLWKWHFDFIELVEKKESNDGHKAIR